MMRGANKILLAVFMAIVAGLTLADAQSFYAVRRNRNLLVSVGSGTASYKGEMVNPGEIGKLKPNIAIGAEYYLKPRLSVRAELTWFILSGDDALANDDRRERNLSFRSTNFELAAMGAYNLTPMGLRFYQRPILNFHAFAGIGVMTFNPKAKFEGQWIPLQPLQTEGVKYSKVQPVIPLGLGARIKLHPYYNLLIEGGYRITFTDYLDDVSKHRYVDPTLLSSDLSRSLSDRRDEIGSRPENPLVGRRGNPSNNDGYFIANITLQYYLPTEILRDSQRKLYNSKRRAIYRRR